MTTMVTLEFPMKDGMQSGFLELLGGALADTRAFDGCIKVETFSETDGSSVLLVEHWKSRKHQEAYFQMRPALSPEARWIGGGALSAQTIRPSAVYPVAACRSHFDRKHTKLQPAEHARKRR